MRGLTGMVLVALAASAGHARAQGVRMPVDADLRSLQAPITYEGSRSQRTQEENGSASTLFGSVRGLGGAPAVAVAPPAAPGSPTRSESLTYTVDVWDGEQVVETVAQSSSLSIARAAFKEALKERAKAKVTLRQGEKVVAQRDVLATAR